MILEQHMQITSNHLFIQARGQFQGKSLHPQYIINIIYLEKIFTAVEV